LERGSTCGSDYSPIGDPPGRRTGDSRHQDSDTGPSEKERGRVLRAIVQKDPWLAKLLKTPEQEAVAPRPGSGAVARRTREHRGSGRGHDGTVDTPAAESEAPEDRDIHRAMSPTPAPETFTQAESTPPPPTPSH